MELLLDSIQPIKTLLIILFRFKDADISVAVGSDNGLITPIVFNANNKPLEIVAA